MRSILVIPSCETVKFVACYVAPWDATLDASNQCEKGVSISHQDVSLRIRYGSASFVRVACRSVVKWENCGKRVATHFPFIPGKENLSQNSTEPEEIFSQRNFLRDKPSTVENVSRFFFQCLTGVT